MQEVEFLPVFSPEFGKNASRKFSGAVSSLLLQEALPWLYPEEGSIRWTLIYLVGIVVYFGTWFATRIAVKALSQAHARRFCRFCQFAGVITYFAVLLGWPVGYVLSHGVRIVSPDLLEYIRWFFLAPAILVVLQYIVSGVGLIVASHSLTSGIDDEMDSVWHQFKDLAIRQLAGFFVAVGASVFLVDILNRVR